MTVFTEIGPTVELFKNIVSFSPLNNMLQPLVATETVSYLAAVVLTEAFGWLVGFWFIY